MLKNKVFVVLMSCLFIGMVLLFAFKVPIDLLVSLQPGWHTVIYPPKLIIAVLFALIAILCMITYLLLRTRKKS